MENEINPVGSLKGKMAAEPAKAPMMLVPFCRLGLSTLLKSEKSN
jgi:hypothetical protein